MSTPSSPTATATWFPQLAGLNLPNALTNGVQQGFNLIYSLRDTVAQLALALLELVLYGTHLERLNTRAESMTEGALWFETDRTTVFYQSRLDVNSSINDWFYAGGIMADLAANRPTDLAANDAGFLFLATDTGGLERWDGIVWASALSGGGGGGGGQTPWASDINAAGHNLDNAGTVFASDFNLTTGPGTFGSADYGVMIDHAGDATFRNIAVGTTPPGTTVINSAGVVSAAGFVASGQTGLNGIFKLTGSDGVTIYTVTFTNGIMTQIV